MTAPVNERPVHRLDFSKMSNHFIAASTLIKEIQRLWNGLGRSRFDRIGPNGTNDYVTNEKLAVPFVIIRQCRNANQQANKETIVPAPVSATRLMVTNYRQEPC